MHHAIPIVFRVSLVVVLCAAGMPAARAQGPNARTVTVADIIQMTTFGSEPQGYLPKDVDVPSPDGRLHAVVVKRGDIERNTNVFSLLVFRTEALFTGPKPDTVLTLASSSNRPAISHITWLSDNHTLAFLGERPGELPQVYTLDVRRRELILRTRHVTELTGMDVALRGDVIVYAAKPSIDTSSYAAMRQRGFALRPTQFVGNVLMGAWAHGASAWFETGAPQFFMQHAGAPRPIQATVPGPSYRSCDPESLSVAPTGRVALIQCTREHAPAGWAEYTEPELAKLISAGATLPEFALLNLERGTVEPFIEAPVLWATFHWAPTGESLVLGNAYLPLQGAEGTDRRLRAARPGVAEVDLRTHHVTLIAHRDSLDVVAWDSATNTIDLVPGMYGSTEPHGPHVQYRRTAHGWNEVRGKRTASQPELIVEEGLNLPPRLVAVDRGTHRRALVLDPNPQITTFRLGRVETVSWRTRGGQTWHAGLYMPPDAIAGHRYPLVIQTHGFDSTAFAPDGAFPTANAAQPMAAQGMVVLQIGARNFADAIRDLTTPQEAPHAMEEIEGAIDHLDSLRLIDRSRVGLIGFSRTCFYVLYTLTHSRYPIAAAAITDGVDFSYLQYLLFRNAALGSGFTLDEDVPINGGPPFGAKLDTWRERAPGFNLDRMSAPLRLEAIGLPSVLAEWEPYAALLLQHKPAELFVIPEGSHLLVKPWERLASAEGNADWFRFWLKGEEDPDPAKAEQYERWRRLRKQQLQLPATQP